MTAHDYRELAERCRALIGTTTEPQLIASLNALAEEYETKAEAALPRSAS